MRPFAAMRLRAGAFDPRSLYAGGRNGVLLLPDTAASMWQDTSAATPAVAGSPGDPIGRINDQSGNGNNATQATATRRPLYQLSSGLYSVEGDATDDVIATAAGGGPTTGFMIVMAVRLDSTPANRYLVYNKAAGNNGFVLYSGSSGQIVLQCWYSGGSVTITSALSAITLGQPFVVAAWYDGSLSHLQIDSQAIVDSTAFTLTPGTAALYIGAALASGVQPMDGGWYSFIYLKDAAPSAAEIANSRAYVAARAGVTL